MPGRIYFFDYDERLRVTMDKSDDNIPKDVLCGYIKKKCSM